MQDFVFNTTPSVIFRAGAARELAKHASAKLGPSVLFVTDPGLRKLGLADAALASLQDAGIKTTVYAEVEADPSLATLEKAVEAGRAAGATGVVGFGGGSSLDVAKLAALLIESDEDIETIWGIGNAKGPRLPLVLIPTTAGTGSEVTPISIITVGEEEKRGISSPFNLPDIALLDPELTIGLPPAITAATGIDAMVHAIEAYASKNANNNPLSKMLAKQALQLLGANIETVVSDGGNIEARGSMLLGSMLAGQAFANSPVAAVHALAYPIGGTFHVPHGLSNALVLPHVLRFNAPFAGQLYTEIAADTFPHLAGNGGSQALTAAFIDELAALAARLGLPLRLRDVGIPESALPKLAADAMKQQRLLVNNPRELSEADALAIYRTAW
ncbi:iron-containing alcohol dehydrogenase [Rhizobium sp. XQZ8]|uniref:iron-containing alcohol dehydrogenase n=1 Tax=Rhizobium populisoli TaxID=2859785 RepID=UPI001C686433|nr:iron-containing alcohol dehydrogenase [Rhizobium populisoli]MBW6422176.1 iron-containing alcohol dehydrogenase [Rhizobium populisoli]